MKQSTPGDFWFVWRIPALLAVLTLGGLLAALLGSGIWRGFAWLALLAPIVVGLWHALRARAPALSSR